MSVILRATIVVCLSIFIISFVLADEQLQVQTNPQVIHEVKHALSLPFRDIAPAMVDFGVFRMVPNHRIPRPKILTQQADVDPSAQTWMSAPNMPPAS